MLLSLLQVQKTYECLPRAAVQYFCNSCPICQQKYPQTNDAPLRPILASGFLTRCQVPKIDLCLQCICNVTLQPIDDGLGVM